MFPLYQKELPASAKELASCLEMSLRRLLIAPGKIVSIHENAYPDLAEIAITIDGAQVRMNASRPSLATDESEPALNVERFTLMAQPLSFGAASLLLNIDAHEVVLHQSRDKNGEIVLLLQRATDGRIAISMRRQDLEAMVGEIAKDEAGKQGVTIEEVRLTLRPGGPRSIGGEVQLRARKLFLRATIRIAGGIEIDDQLVARVRDLTCTGEGAIATLACSVLAPHLQKLSGRDFELMALPLGEVRLRDVKVAVDDAIKISAEFGSVDDRQLG